MDYYWAILIIVISSMATLFMAAKWAQQLKHSYDDTYHPKFYVNEPEVYTIGAFFGGLGLLLSFIFLKPIRTEDSLNSWRFLWISIGATLVQAAIVFVLFYYQIIKIA